MSFLAVNLWPETQSVLANGSIGASYVAIGTSLNPTRMLIVQNFTDKSMQFSLDGVNDHFPLLSNGTLIMDLNSNKSNLPCMGSAIPQGTTIYVKQISAPSSGSVYVTFWYGKAG